MRFTRSTAAARSADASPPAAFVASSGADGVRGDAVEPTSPRYPRAARRALAAALLAVFAASGCGAARRTPIPDRPINLAGSCAQTEADGFREDARLLVRANRVDELSWQIWVGKRGSCRFDLTEFRQVRSRPSIELAAVDGSACKLMVWQDPRRITLAHAGCEARCTAGIYEEAWPVMFEPRNGGCATR